MNCVIVLHKLMTLLSRMLLIRSLVFVLLFFQVKSSTHWVVTEDGRIQQQLESPFAMKQPDDLVTFLKQDRMHTYLKETKEQLLQEQFEIDKNEDKDVKLESRHFRQDPDCRLAGKNLTDFDFFITSILSLENKNIEVNDHIHIVKVSPSEVHEPNCTKAYDLPYSIHAYDHLQGVQNRHFFPSLPVAGLKSTMPFLERREDAATAIYNAMLKNSTSWVLYDLASFYWRMNGNLKEAVECLRRALHFSPETYKDVALVHLANILHRVHYTLNATVVMQHALKISGEFSINYFTLANMYAALEAYNESIRYFEQTLERQSDFEAARKELAAVKCQLKLQDKLEKQHSSLQRTLEELQRYKVKHEEFLEEQLHFTSLHLSASTLAEQHMYYEHQRMKEGTFNHNCHHVRTNKSGSILVCSLPTPDSESWFVDDEDNFVDETSEPIPMARKRKKADAQAATDRQYTMRKRKSKKPQAGGKEKESAADETIANKTTQQDYDWTNTNWPPMEACDKFDGNEPIWDEFPSAYIDPETRGFKVRELLTSYIGIEEGEMHELPWVKPDCVKLESIETTPYDHFIRLDAAVSFMKQDIFLQNFMLMHVNKGRVWPDDLGQRILTALKKSLENEDKDNIWVLYNLAGLFWRVDGDNRNAIECLRRSVYRVPTQHADIPLVSLSNIMYRIGKVNDSVRLLIFALKINNSEPATYLSMGNALQAQNNISGSIQFYTYAMVLNPQYKEAYHSLLTVKCHNISNTETKEESALETLAKWNAEVSSTNEEVTEGGNTRNNEVASNVDSVEDEVGFAEEAANQLLKESDEIVKDLSAKDNENLEEKLVIAKELITKLNALKSTIGAILSEAPARSDKDANSPTCDEAMEKVDFRYVTNTTFMENLKVEFSSNMKSDSLLPNCDETLLSADEDMAYAHSLTGGPKEVIFLQKLKETLETPDVTSALRSALLYDPTSWKLYLLTSFFWRISGNAKKAMTCILVALAKSTAEGHDVSYYVMADYLAVLSLYDDAFQVADELFVTKESIQVAYLMGNILAAKGDFANAAKYYKSTMEKDENFADCQLRYKAALCRCAP